MKEILKALREQKKIRFDVYKKNSSLAFWIMLEKCEVLIINNKLDLEGKIMTDEETADKEQDDLLDQGYKPIKIDDNIIKAMEKIQKKMLAKALGI